MCVCFLHAMIILQALKSKLEALSSDHRNACEKVDVLTTDLNALKKEREDLALKVKEFGQNSVPIDDIKVSLYLILIINFLLTVMQKYHT